MLEKVIQFVNDSFGSGVNEKSMAHFEKTVEWLKILYPEADEPMLIAAYSHDIARAFRTKTAVELFKDKEFNDPDILKAHQNNGARIMSEYLKKHEYPESAIRRVNNMISKHEEGGDVESNFLKDADSLSYLEVNAKKHIGMIDKLGKDKVERKIDWMFERITSSKAKELAIPFYAKAKDLLS